MKKFKKVLSLLMMSAMLVLPMAMPVQADEVKNDTKEVVTYNTNEINASTQSIPSGYTIKATINANNVNLRNYSGVSLGQLHKGEVVYLKSTSVTVVNGIPSRYCYSPKHGYYGYVSISYMDI